MAGCTPNKRVALAAVFLPLEVMRTIPSASFRTESGSQSSFIIAGEYSSGYAPREDVYCSVPPSSSSNALASVKSAVSKPSVNQL